MKALPAPSPVRQKRDRAKETKKRKPGGGRKKGFKAVLTAEIAQDATLAGITPVEIMLHHARYAHQRAIVLAGDFERSVMEIASMGDPDKIEDAMASATDVLNNMLKFSNNACLYANMAAPYCHSRLNAITVEDKTKQPLDLVEGKVITQEEAAELYRKLIK